VRRIVAFGKPQPLQTRLQPLKPVIEDSLTLVRAALPATVQIDSQLDSNVPPVNIDSAQIDQVLLNLCTNAWHAMPHQKGRIEIRLSTSEISTATVASAGELQPGHYARLSVCDNGTGIDPLILPRIFEPFFTTKPAGEGTGLGLSIVYNIVRGHAGAIIVSSPPGHGTCFDIYLPLNGAGAPEMQTAPALTPINTQGSGQHIVYIDDEEALVILTVKMLQRLGYQVTGFTDAEAALHSLQTGAVHPDVVITDQSMPGMTGSELARVLLRQYPGMLMILVSGYLPAEEIELARQQGFRAVILKPDTVDQMARTIHDVLSEQQAAVMMPQ
jgi:CheY-like chemotaxis protein